MDKLKRSNIIFAVLHTSALLGLYGLYRKYNKGYSVTSLYRNKLPSAAQLNDPLANSEGVADNNPPATAEDGQCKINWPLGPPEKVVSFNIVYAVLIFFAITALFHIFYATSHKYVRVIEEGWNPYRWLEYSLSASIMSVLIAGTLGVKDISTLSIFALITAAMQGCGFVVESILRHGGHINHTAIIGATTVGWLLLLSIWGPSIYAFRNVIKDLKQYGSVQEPLKIPRFVYFILGVQLLNFSSFGFIQLLQVRAALKGRPLNFLHVESKYIALSFFGKLLLAGGLGYGVVFRTKDCPAP